MLERLGQRFTGRLPRDPDATAFPRAIPAPANPRAERDRFLATWVGHSTFLLQIGGLNVLTDPMWGPRASPLSFAGPVRWVPAAPALEELPPIDIVVQSHNHYDHLDAWTVGTLANGHPRARWAAPLGVAPILKRYGARDVTELDWWESMTIGDASLGCTPACHFSGRGVRDRNETLWCGWSVAAGAHRAYFAGDTGVHPEFAQIAERFGPFDLAMLPIGAYAPRWFMRPVHVAPAEAIAAYQTIRAVFAPGHRSLMAAMHWGTFKLSDEPMDEPPRQVREEWTRLGLDPDQLWIPRHGETREIQAPTHEPRSRGT
jgi:N-acyl-phosphatidylethanolamine-hydrolysing phospholipase D